MVEAANENPLVLDDPKPFAVFEDFAESALTLTLRCYLPNVDNRLTTMHQLRTAIDRKFKKAGLEIPFPQRDLHVRSVDPAIKLNGDKSQNSPDPAAEKP
jgi:potassium efflux system protein